MEHMECIATRTLDELGRIVLPKEVRDQLKWKEGDSFSIHYVDEHSLMLKISDVK